MAGLEEGWIEVNLYDFVYLYMRKASYVKNLSWDGDRMFRSALYERERLNNFIGFKVMVLGEKKVEPVVFQDRIYFDGKISEMNRCFSSLPYRRSNKINEKQSTN